MVPPASLPLPVLFLAPGVSSVHPVHRLSFASSGLRPNHALLRRAVLALALGMNTKRLGVRSLLAPFLPDDALGTAGLQLETPLCVCACWSLTRRTVGAIWT